ncbi:HAD-IB family hydrolase [bacterium endosymbiont of Escarpia laminata]|nr:MAG: HAD-IB family hydrolase [bacterium endosymbiont of Escarpia laminata]RLJ21318.1 MAG: HAD-IB family hydrolase [bacterium endosymbiont of Escarpia laminata]
MALALFDLDNTLLAGDSDYLWGTWLVENGVVDGEFYERENERFYQEYKEGRLDILEFLRFSLRPLRDHEPDQLLKWRATFLTDKIDPIISSSARQLLQKHRDAGDELMIITATNAFVTAPIAERFGVKNLIATEPEIINGHYTGEVTGEPCFQSGKVNRLNQWLAKKGMDLRGSWFYSDSHNDIPLLERVDHPVAVDPDEALVRHAGEKGWPILRLHGEK